MYLSFSYFHLEKKEFDKEERGEARETKEVRKKIKKDEGSGVSDEEVG